MSRTYRHTSKNNKVIRGHVISYYFDCCWHSTERRVERFKGGAIMDEDNKSKYQKYLHGHYKTGVPRKYRKHHNRLQKTKMNADMNRKIREERYDEIGGEKYVCNAGWYYY